MRLAGLLSLPAKNVSLSERLEFSQEEKDVAMQRARYILEIKVEPGWLAQSRQSMAAATPAAGIAGRTWPRIARVPGFAKHAAARVISLRIA